MHMLLKQPINAVEFFMAIDHCRGEVLLHTKEKDILNLRSRLCRFIFAVALSERPFFDGAYVECTDASDYAVLQDYLTK